MTSLPRRILAVLKSPALTILALALYVFAVLPLALWRRTTGRKRIQMRPDLSSSSYWKNTQGR